MKINKILPAFQLENVPLLEQENDKDTQLSVLENVPPLVRLSVQNDEDTQLDVLEAVPLLLQDNDSWTGET